MTAIYNISGRKCYTVEIPENYSVEDSKKYIHTNITIRDRTKRVNKTIIDNPDGTFTVTFDAVHSVHRIKVIDENSGFLVDDIIIVRHDKTSEDIDRMMAYTEEDYERVRNKGRVMVHVDDDRKLVDNYFSSTLFKIIDMYPHDIIGPKSPLFDIKMKDLKADMVFKVKINTVTKLYIAEKTINVVATKIFDSILMNCGRTYDIDIDGTVDSVLDVSLSFIEDYTCEYDIYIDDMKFTIRSMYLSGDVLMYDTLSISGGYLRSKAKLGASFKETIESIQNIHIAYIMDITILL